MGGGTFKPGPDAPGAADPQGMLGYGWGHAWLWLQQAPRDKPPHQMLQIPFSRAPETHLANWAEYSNLWASLK